MDNLKKKVLELLAKGKYEKEIREELNITAGWYDWHIRKRLFIELKAHNAAEAVINAKYLRII